VTASGSAPASEQTPRPGTWAALRFRQYRILWLATIAAILTAELRLIVTGVWLYEETGSAAQLGVLGLIQLFVQIPALLFGGTLADRLDRRLLMAWTQGVTLLFVAGLALLVIADTLEPWHVYAATAVLSVSTVFGNPARAALISATVPLAQLRDAVTTNWMTQQVAIVVAPLGFAATVQVLDLDAAFVLTAIVAVPGVVLPLMMRVRGVPAQLVEGGSMLRRTWDGLRFVRGHPLLPALFLMDTGVTVVNADNLDSYTK